MLGAAEVGLAERVAVGGGRVAVPSWAVWWAVVGGQASGVPLGAVLCLAVSWLVEVGLARRVAVGGGGVAVPSCSVICSVLLVGVSAGIPRGAVLWWSVSWPAGVAWSSEGVGGRRAGGRRPAGS